MSAPAINIAIRGFQILFASVVTGLSIQLARGHHWGATPATLVYASFVGCISLIAAFVGLAAAWVNILQGHVGMIMDGVVTFLNLAGGILIATKLGGVSCMWTNNANAIRLTSINIINGGKHGNLCYYCRTDDDAKTLIARCKENQADSAFMFLTFVLLSVSFVLTHLRMKRGY